ncbi:MAG: SET domain-containing protein-lysine N-methyltransferase [Gammaproteobacteria bacterium]|nr:SET domain-containing protein-lysine N-methyltransferase [Gammaproteobacteria bacterium]
MKMLSYRSPKTEVKASPIEGKGLFAREAIAKHEIVAIKGGSIVDAATWNELEKELGSAEIQVNEDFFFFSVTPEEREGSMLYTNHSCDPNIAFQGQIVVIAMRDIAAGEELTHDWATTDNLDYEVQCRCGSPQCRGTITGKDWRIKSLQEKYRGYFAWHIQHKIDHSL